jgi:hypothetical protein
LQIPKSFIGNNNICHSHPNTMKWREIVSTRCDEFLENMVLYISAVTMATSSWYFLCHPRAQG